VNSDNHGNVVEFKGGKMSGAQLSGVSLALPGVPAFDSADNLDISDWRRGTIDVYAYPATALVTGVAPDPPEKYWLLRIEPPVDLAKMPILPR
jgi:hypothetical protein